MKTPKLLIAMALVGVLFAGCGSPSSSPANAPGDGSIPGQVGEESSRYFSNVDSRTTVNQGDVLVAERFYVLIAKMSVFSLICDSKNERKDATKVSKLFNASVDLQKTAEKEFGGDIPAYNRLEKERNIESKRLSFDYGPAACQNSQNAFNRFVTMNASEFANVIRTTAYGAL